MQTHEAIAPHEIRSIASHEKRSIRTLLWGLKPFSNLRGSFPLSYAVVFLTVAMEEGKPMGTYGRELGLSRFNVSRYLRCIGDRGRNGTAGLGLVSVTRTEGHPIRTKVCLTDKGRALAEQVFRNLR